MTNQITAKTNRSYHFPTPKLELAGKWSDSELVKRALSSDPIAKNTIFRRHAPYLFNLAARLTRSSHLAEDVLQDTFLRAFQKLGKLKNPSALRPWLIQILVSQAKKSLNKKRIQDYFGLAYDDDNATLEQLAVHDAHPDLREELRDIDAKLSRVPRDWRTAWLLHRIEDMSMPETAQAINRSVSTVKRYVAAVDSVIGPKRN